MLSSIATVTRSALRQPTSRDMATHAINRAVTSGYLRALQHFSQPAWTSSSVQSPQAVSRRTMVSKAIAERLKTAPAMIASRENFRFARTRQSEIDTRLLQRAVLAQMAGMAQPVSVSTPPMPLAVQTNPTATDIERLVARHGPVSLSLLGLLPKNQGDSAMPRRHTVLVLYTFRDQHGACFAVAADGNPHARNALTQAAASAAQQKGKQLHELDRDDLASLESELTERDEHTGISEAIHDLINLDRAIEMHEATTVSYRNFLRQVQKDIALEGLASDEVDADQMAASAVAYAAETSVDGTLPAAIIEALRTRIQEHPDEVKPFVALHSAGAREDLFEQVPAVRDVFNTPSIAGRWSPPTTVAELKNALRQEPTFAAVIDAPENQQRLQQLCDAIAAVALPPNHRGVSIQLQFPVTYGHVAHIAPINLWREASSDGQPGKLMMGCLHQEATPISGKVWEGEVHTSFDTSKVHPSGIAPVAESIKFTGLPNIATILPCKYPDKIVPLTRAMAGPENGYPYGGTPSWHGDKGRFAPTRPFNSCSNTSYEAHMICNGKYPTYQSTLPELWNAEIGELYGVDQKKIQTCKIGETIYQVKDMLDLPFEIVGAMWPKVTIHSASLPSAVACTFAPHHPTPVTLSVGKDLRLPPEMFPRRFYAARFINPTNDMRLSDGTPIKNGITYLADEIHRGIIYSNDKPGKKIDYWLSGVDEIHSPAA